MKAPIAASEPIQPTAKSSQDAGSWASVPALFRTGPFPLPEPWEGLFGALRMPGPDGLTVIGQLGQSLDGRIATPTGHSHYINGPAGIDHLHRIRALVDVVVVGADLGDDAVVEGDLESAERLTDPAERVLGLDHGAGRSPVG